MKKTKIIAVLAIVAMMLSMGVAYADTVYYNEGPFDNYELVKGIYKINDYYFNNYTSDVDVYYNGTWHESGDTISTIGTATSKYGTINGQLECNYPPVFLGDGDSYTHEADWNPSYIGWTRIKLRVDVYGGGYRTRVTGIETSWH